MNQQDIIVKLVMDVGWYSADLINIYHMTWDELFEFLSKFASYLEYNTYYINEMNGEYSEASLDNIEAVLDAIEIYTLNAAEYDTFDKFKKLGIVSSTWDVVGHLEDLINELEE